MQITAANFEDVQDAKYHGEEVSATLAQAIAILGAPSITYGPDEEQKQRTEWDRIVDGVEVKVFDHHHYGAVTPETRVAWDVEASDGSSKMVETAGHEFVAEQQPTPVEKEIANAIANA